MKQIRILLITAIFLMAQSAFPWFEEFRQSVKGKSMGNASYSTFDGVASLYYNPASIAHQKTVDVMMSVFEPAGGFTKFDDGSSLFQFDMSVVTPFANPVNLKTAGWVDDFITTDAGFGLSFIQQSYDSGDGTATVAQRYVGLSYAKRLDDVLFKGARLSVGITGNIYMLSFAGQDVENNAAFKNTDSAAFSPDIGVIYNFSDDILVSVIVENLLPTSLSPFKDGERLTSNTILGLSYAFGDIGALPLLQDITINGAWKMISPADQGANSTSNLAGTDTYHVGWESWYKIPEIEVAARSGFSMGDMEYSEFDFGLGIGRAIDPAQKHRVDLDMAWAWSSMFNGMGADHRYYVSLLYKYKFDSHLLPKQKVQRSLDVKEDLTPETPEETTPPKTENGKAKIKVKSKGQ